MTISFEDFKKIDIKIGEVVSVEEIEGSEKLLKLNVFFGTETRQVVSGIKNHVDSAQSLVGRKFPFVFNLESRTIFGLESHGMILCASDDNNFSLLEPTSPVDAGSSVK